MKLFKQINYFLGLCILTIGYCATSMQSQSESKSPAVTKEEVISLEKNVNSLFPKAGITTPGYHTEICEYELLGLTRSELASFIKKLPHGDDPHAMFGGPMFGGPPELSSDGTKLTVFKDLDHGPEYFKLTYKNDKVDTVQHHVGGFVGDRLPGFTEAFRPQDGPELNSKESAMEYTLKEKDWQIHSDFYKNSPVAIAHFYCVCGKVHLAHGEWQTAKEDFLLAKAQLQESAKSSNPPPRPKRYLPLNQNKIMRID